MQLVAHQRFSIRQSGSNVHVNASKGDFATDTRLLRITAIAAVVGILSTLAADFLLHLIRFFTNVFFFQTMSIAATFAGRQTPRPVGRSWCR